MPYKAFIQGFQKFRRKYMEGETSLFQQLIEKGQSPETLVIACSDSRNDPALLMQSHPGDLFVVRNVAALVPPYEPDGHYHGTSAAIEFAVKGLKVKNIVVLGHGLCGGIQALSKNEDKDKKYEFLSPWVSICAAARDVVRKELGDLPPDAQQRALEQVAILTSLNNLLTFPWISQAVEEGHLVLHGWYFDMAHGQLLGYQSATGSFEPLEKGLENIAGFTDTCCLPSFLKAAETW